MPENVVSQRAAARPTDLRAAFHDLERRAGDVLGHELLRSPSAALDVLSRSLRETIDRTRAFLQRPDATADSLLPFLKAFHAQIDTLLAQLTLCQSTVRECRTALEWGRRLVAQERISFRELIPLSRRLFDEVRDAPALRRLVPVCGLDLTDFVASQAGEAALFVHGLTAARVLLWTMRENPRDLEKLPEFALAALFQDLGRLLAMAPTAAARKFNARRTEWLEREHPAIGAALLGAVREAPSGLALMVAQHHERLDGRGSPRGLTAREILLPSRRLALCSRFAEMCLKASPADGLEPGQNLPERVARSLRAEAEWGMWSGEFAGRLCALIASTEPAEPEFAAQQSPTLEIPVADESADPADRDWADRSLHLHDPEHLPQGMHAEAERLEPAIDGRTEGFFSAIELESLRPARRRPGE